jgi:hypothetical protein
MSYNMVSVGASYNTINCQQGDVSPTAVLVDVLLNTDSVVVC